MAVEVSNTHPFQSAKSDGADATRVKPSNWNADHVYAGGVAGAAVVWDDSQTNKASWGFFDHHNYAYNALFDIWGSGTTTVPTGWRLVGAGATISQDAVNIKYGTYSTALVRVGTDCYMAQDISLVWGSLEQLKGKTVALGAWVKCSVGSVARLTIADGVSSASSSYHTGDGTFQFLKVELAVDLTATVVELRLGIDTGNATAQFSGVIASICGSAELKDFSISSYVPKKHIVYAGANAAQTQNTTSYYGPWESNTTEAFVSWATDRDYVVRNLSVTMSAAPAAGQTASVVLRVGESTDSAVGVVVSSAGRTNTNQTDELLIPAGTLLNFKCVLSATSGDRAFHISLEFEEVPESF